MNFVNSKKSHLGKKFDVAHGVDKADAGFRKERFVLNNSKQKHKKFPNFDQNFLENEIIFAKMGVSPNERNVTLGLF